MRHAHRQSYCSCAAIGMRARYPARSSAYAASGGRRHGSVSSWRRSPMGLPYFSRTTYTPCRFHWIGRFQRSWRSRCNFGGNSNRCRYIGHRRWRRRSTAATTTATAPAFFQLGKAFTSRCVGINPVGTLITPRAAPFRRRIISSASASRALPLRYRFGRRGGTSCFRL
jgi:hypothetical protein